jgi:hypothetical protein
MKNLSLKICLVIAALLVSVGSGFAEGHLPKCAGGPVPKYSPNHKKIWKNWDNCIGKVTIPDGFYHGEFKNGLWNGQGIYFLNRNDLDVKKYCVGKTVYNDIYCDHASRKRYLGNWKDGFRTGYGIQTYWDGNIKEGIWTRNLFQYSFKPPKMSLLQNAFMQLEENQRRRLQTKLKNLGYYKSSIDGIYGKGTATALNLYNEMHLSKSDLSRDKNIEQLINSVLGIKPVPKSKKVIVEKTPNNAIAQNKNDLPLVVLKLGVVPPFKCAFVISGEINHELYKSFEKSLQENRNPSDCRKSDAGFASSNLIKTVILRTSRGGDLNAAFNIMKLIRRHNLVTQIDSDLTDFCLSSCALIFASGTQRHWTMNNDLGNPKLVLGIHKPDLVEGTYDFLKREKILDELKYEIIDFLAKGGVDARFSIKMFETSNENMMFPKMQDLLVWRTVTELEDPQYFKNLKLRSGYSDKVFAKPIAGQNNFGRPFAYHGWLLKNQSMENSKDYQTVSTALREVNQLLNFQIVDD